MKMPSGKLAAFIYAIVLGIAIMCAITSILFLLMHLLAGNANAASLQPRDAYHQGIPYNYTRYPSIEQELRDIKQRLEPRINYKCNACILEQYYNTTPDERLQHLRNTIRKYYGGQDEHK